MTRGWLALSMQRFSRGSRGTPLSYSRVYSNRAPAQHSGAVSDRHNAELCIYGCVVPRSSILNCHQRDRLRNRAYTFLCPRTLYLPFLVTTSRRFFRFPCRDIIDTLEIYRVRRRDAYVNAS